MKKEGSKLRCASLALFTKAAHELAMTSLVGACFFSLTSGCVLFRPTSPVLHEPNCDLSPVLAVQLPAYIDTLSAIPRDRTIAENGKYVDDGTRSADDMKEFFYVKKGDVEYQFQLFFNEGSAIRFYESWKRDHPVFRETTVDGCSACVHFTEQPRSDPEGGSTPMGYYISRASFRLHNVLIRVTAQDNKPQSDTLTNAIKDLAQMLNGALSTPR